MLFKRKFTLSMRRLPLMLVLVAAVVQTGWPQAWAAPVSPVQVTIGSMNVTKGRTVQIPVSIGQPETGIGSYGIQIDFDNTAFQVLSITPRYGSDDEMTCSTADEGCFKSFFDNKNGWIRVIWADASGGDRPINAAQELFAIQAVATTTGEKAFAVKTSDPSNLTFTDTDMNILPVQTAEGQLIVKQPNKSRPVSSNQGQSSSPAQSNPSSTQSSTPEQSNPSSAQSSSPMQSNPSSTQSSPVTTIKTEVNDRTVVTVNVDEEKAIEQLNSSQEKTLVVPANEAGDEVVGELNGKLVKAMEGQEAKLEIQTDRAVYTLPASQINIDRVSSSFGNEVPLQDIKISVTIAETDSVKKEQVSKAAANGGMSVTIPPVNFEVKAKYGDKTVEVDRFNNYVERAIALPNGIDPAKMTTGVVAGDDGSLTHVPTKITQIDGKYYAVINSLTNSTYTVVWHPKSFADTKDYWAGREIDDLASRLVVQGVTEDTFAPEREITRAEFTAILLRALGLHEERDGSQAAFTDIGEHDWFGHDVSAAASYGLIGGYTNGTFRPNDTITRVEAMVMLSRASALAKLNPADPDEADKLLETFEDQGSVGDWARQAVANAVKQGIVQGSGRHLEPTQPITRAQTAVMVRRMLVQAQLINN
ncbi:S-layer homology domain-containing protein [Paenibacillus sp. TAB 01]|uniref:S-layer homology domain-containing protein n=1 Tax=Paenibacillus sp. TAB 01 TaxID=3368988 RepID=UPI0037528F8E